MPRKTTTVACIPVYNEETSIASVVFLTKKYVDHVIVCDDGSVDLTASLAESLGALVIRHDENQGKGESLRTAILEALNFNPDYVVTLDGDGQHSPQEIPGILEPLIAGEADIVIGSRFINGNHNHIPYYRKIGLGIIDQVFKRGIKQVVRDSQSGFRAYNREAVETILETRSTGFGIETEQIALATKKGLRIKEVEAYITYYSLEKTARNIR